MANIFDELESASMAGSHWSETTSMAASRINRKNGSVHDDVADERARLWKALVHHGRKRAQLINDSNVEDEDAREDAEIAIDEWDSHLQAIIDAWNVWMRGVKSQWPSTATRDWSKVEDQWRHYVRFRNKLASYPLINEQSEAAAQASALITSDEMFPPHAQKRGRAAAS